MNTKTITNTIVPMLILAATTGCNRTETEETTPGYDKLTFSYETELADEVLTVTADTYPDATRATVLENTREYGIEPQKYTLECRLDVLPYTTDERMTVRSLDCKAPEWVEYSAEEGKKGEYLNCSQPHNSDICSKARIILTEVVSRYTPEARSAEKKSVDAGVQEKLNELLKEAY